MLHVARLALLAHERSVEDRKDGAETDRTGRSRTRDGHGPVGPSASRTMPVRRTGVAIRVAVGGGPVVMPRHARASCVNPVPAAGPGALIVIFLPRKVGKMCRSEEVLREPFGVL